MLNSCHWECQKKTPPLVLFWVLESNSSLIWAEKGNTLSFSPTGKWLLTTSCVAEIVIPWWLPQLSEGQSYLLCPSGPSFHLSQVWAPLPPWKPQIQPETCSSWPAQLLQIIPWAPQHLASSPHNWALSCVSWQQPLLPSPQLRTRTKYCFQLPQHLLENRQGKSEQSVKPPYILPVIPESTQHRAEYAGGPQQKAEWMISRCLCGTSQSAVAMVKIRQLWLLTSCFNQHHGVEMLDTQ